MSTHFTRRALSIFATLILLAALLSVSASASRPAVGASVTVRIPFNFVVAGHNLPAGEYLVQRSTLASTEGLVIRGLEGNTGVFILTTQVRANQRQDASRLVFNRYKEKYFLSQFWTAGDAGGRELIKSSEERTLQRELASRGIEAERVAINIPQK